MRSAIIAVRVEPHIKTLVQRAATDDHRSVASLVEKLLIEHLTKHGYLEKTQAK
ncbi:MAG: hypothetical protein ACE5H8_15495 [Alphaproteobacteria bacterium]